MANAFSNFFTNRNRNWFYIFGSIFIILVTIYVILHSLPGLHGEEIVNFTKQEIANIETIVDNSNLPDDTTAQNKRNLTQAQRDTIKANVERYILSRYDLADGGESLQELRLFLTQYANADFPTSFLTEYKLNVHSYFWLTEDFVFLEIIFWSLFGVLCSLFYYISEAIASGTYKAQHEYVHAAKLFYAPATTLIVYFSINALVSNGEVNLNSLRYGLLILSYVLGFFSARTIELLSRIKDLLLPGGKRSAEGEQAETLGKWEELSPEQQQEKIEKLRSSKDWRAVYPYVESTSIGAKYTNGERVSVLCLVFKVSKKIKDIPEESKIPPQIEFDGYFIPTDVQELGNVITQQLQIDPKDNPKKLGSGISRRNHNNFGSIGLKVKQQDGKFYIVSCYHVLFGKELEERQLKEVNSQSEVAVPDIVCPCFKHGGKDDAKIGSAVKGVLTSELDLALAVVDNQTISNNFTSTRSVQGIRVLTGNDIKKGTLVKSWGRISEKKGVVKGINDNSVPIVYLPNSPRAFTHHMNGLIRTTCISLPGDSGGLVTDENDMAIGIIVAGDPKIDETYIIPIQKVIANNKFKQLFII